MTKSLATGSMSNHAGDVELQAIREETSFQVLANNNNNNNNGSQTREATQTGGDSSSSDSLTETERKLRGPLLLSTEPTPSFSASNNSTTAAVLEMEAATSGSSKLSQPSSKGFLLTDADSFLVDWAYTALIGFFVVSYWRGGWVLLDIILCDQPGTAGLINGESFCWIVNGPAQELRRKSAIQSLVAGYILLGIGWMALGLGLWQPSQIFVKDKPTKTTIYKGPIRMIIVLLLGSGTINLWRSIWYLLDYYVFPDDSLKSFKITTGVGVVLCACLCSTASMLAPPAIFLMDGPSHLPPPIGVTIITSYRSIAYPASVAREKTEKDPIWLVAVDIFLSYVLLPVGVVGYWRGFWLLMDQYLWGFTGSQVDVNLSILYSALIGMGSLFLGSEDIVQHFCPENWFKSQGATKLANEVFGRARSMILAVGAVNFWRAVWYVWDEYLGKTHTWSAVLSHVIGIVGLSLLGCLSCVTAPPSTIGVDATAHPDCADEPLFHMVPVPAEAIYIMSIARKPDAVLSHIQSAEGDALSDRTIIPDPRVLADATKREDFEIVPEVYKKIDELLVQEDYIYSDEARTTRFTEQTASHIQCTARGESSSNVRLNKRHMLKREKSQFFRNR